MRIARLLAFTAISLFPALGSSYAENEKWSLVSGLYQDSCSVFFPRAMKPRLDFGSGAVPGMTGSHALFVSGDVQLKYFPHLTDETLPAQASFVFYGGLQHDLSLSDWRGKRVRVSLRLQNDPGARAYAAVQINKSNDTAMRSAAQSNDAGADGWQMRNFVLDIPDNATDLIVMVGLTGHGKIWLDDFKLEAAGASAPATVLGRVEGAGSGPDCVPHTGPVAAMPGTLQRTGTSPYLSQSRIR